MLARILACSMLALTSLCSFGCERTGASAHAGDEHRGGATDVAPAAGPKRFGELTCPTLAACLEPVRRALPASDAGAQNFAKLERLVATDRPAAVRLFATPPATTDIVVELPLRPGDPTKALTELGLSVAGGGETLTIQGKPARIVGDRLLVASSGAALTAAIAEPPSPPASGEAVVSAVFDLDAVPAEVRSTWIARLQARADSQDGSFAEQLRRAGRFESIVETLRDGQRISAALRPAAHGPDELSFTVSPRAGSWLETHARTNAALQSRLAAIVPTDTYMRLVWVEADMLREEERREALASLDELEPLLPDVPAELGLPAGSELEVVPLLQDVLGLARVLFEHHQFDWVAFVTDDKRSLVMGVSGFPHDRVDGVLGRVILLLQRHSVPWVKSASTKKRGRHRIHELVIATPEKLRALVGDTTTVTAGTQGDSLLVVIEGKAKKPRLPALLDGLARAPTIAVPLRDVHVDVARLLAVFGATEKAKAELVKLFGAHPETFAVGYRTQVEGTALVSTLRVDLDAWLGLVSRLSAPPPSPQ